MAHALVAKSRLLATAATTPASWAGPRSCLPSLLRHSTRTLSSLPPSSADTPPPVSPHIDPSFRYGDVLVINDSNGERRLFGPLKKGLVRDNNLGRLRHDDLVGQKPLSTVKTNTGAKYTLHWPSLDEYSTKVKRQASIMYPKDTTSAVHLLDLFPGAHVLEAGTGNGSMTMYIQRAIMAQGSHLDTVDIRDAHSMQAEKNIEQFWRGMYRPGITFWRSSGGLQRVIKRLNGTDQTPEFKASLIEGIDPTHPDGRPLSDLELRRKKLNLIHEDLPKNPHPEGHQYDAISLDLPDTKSVILDLLPLLKADRPMVLYMVNMSQVLELVQWMRLNCHGCSVENVLEVGWKEWSVRSAAVRSKVKGRVHVGGFGAVSVLKPATSSAGPDDQEDGSELTTAPDNIPDDAVGWICRPLHVPVGHTGFLVQLRKNYV